MSAGDVADEPDRSVDDAPSSETGSDDELITQLLGRRPQGDYTVVVRGEDGSPVVLANAPLLHGGRPMPTRYWLIDPALNKAIGRLESIGGVKQAEAAVDPDALQAAHDRYRVERDRLIPATHSGPRPSGGVGGTRVGVKCLHAHYAYLLAGGDDPVGRWVHGRLSESGSAFLGTMATMAEHVPFRSPGDDVEGTKPTEGFAVVEIGSGAVKALIERPDGSQTSLRHQTRLLKHLDGDGHLSDFGRAALTRALNDVRSTVDAQLRRPAVPVIVVTTEAVRVAGTAEVAVLVSEVLDCPLHQLTGRQEAEYGYLAVDPETNAPAGPVVTVDIGYGSTELATRQPDGLLAMSLPIGAETVTTGYLHHDPPEAIELSAALSVIELHLDDVSREHPELAEAIGSTEIRGLGAIRFIAEVELGSNDGDGIDGYWLDRRNVEEVFRALATESQVDRAANPGLRQEHVDVIVGATCILVEFMRQFAVDRIRVSTGGVIDGLAGLVRAGRFPEFVEPHVGESDDMSRRPGELEGEAEGRDT